MAAITQIRAILAEMLDQCFNQHRWIDGDISVFISNGLWLFASQSATILGHCCVVHAATHAGIQPRRIIADANTMRKDSFESAFEKKPRI